MDSPELNYFNYFTEIERFYQRKRESFTLLSSLDWVLVENWKEQGIPLEIVLKGIDRAFSQAKRKVNSLAYCLGPVADVLAEHKDAHVAKPDAEDVPAEEVRQYLESLAEKTRAVAVALPEFSTKIASIADAVCAVDPSRFRDAEQSLAALEERLIAILKVGADESVLIEVQRGVQSELAPFRSTMTAAQLAMLEQQLWRRKLLERFNAPRLSLFYLI